MKEYLENIIRAKNKRAEELRAAIRTAESADEVRSLGETLTAVLKELQDAKDQLDKLPDDNGDEPPASGDTGRSAPLDVIDGVKDKRMTPLFGASIPGATKPEARTEDPMDSESYRSAFMDYVQRSVPIPAELRADEVTNTTDAATVIPTVLVNQIIEKMDNVGMIMPLVTKTSYASGVEIPTSSVKPVATWVNEGAGSATQKKTTGKITFTKYKLRCAIAMTMEVGTMALAVFETKFVENVTKAMIKAIESAIISGTGTGQPKGILAETPPTNQALSIALADKLTYATLIAAESAIPEEYEGSAKWCMSKKTFLSFVGMTDSNGQPIARTNYGISGKPERTLLGREVVLASTYMANYADTVTSDTIFAFLFNFSDYILNTVYDMGISKRQNWDNEDYETKAVMSVDGKVVDTTSLVTLTKKST